MSWALKLAPLLSKAKIATSGFTDAIILSTAYGAPRATRFFITSYTVQPAAQNTAAAPQRRHYSPGHQQPTEPYRPPVSRAI